MLGHPPAMTSRPAHWPGPSRQSNGRGLRLCEHRGTVANSRSAGSTCQGTGGLNIRVYRAALPLLSETNVIP